MANFENRLTLESARALLQRAGNETVYIRVAPQSRSGCAHQHWSGGRLLGVNGRYLIFRPQHGHERDEKVDPDLSQVWKARMSPRIFQIWQDIIHAQAEMEQAMVDTRYERVKAAEAPAAAYSPSRELNQESGPLTAEPPQPAAEATAPPPQPMPVQAAAKSASFEDKLKLLARLEAEVRDQASTEGLDRLKRLRADREEALTMVRDYDVEIENLSESLRKLGVLEAPAVTAAKKASDGRRQGMSEKKLLARRCREQAIQWLREHGNPWTRSHNLARATEWKLPPFRLFRSLLTKGVLEQTGESNNPQLRLKFFASAK